MTIARTHPCVLRWRNQDADFDGAIAAQFLSGSSVVLVVQCGSDDPRTISCALTADQIEQLHTAQATRIELVYADQTLVADSQFPLIIRTH